MRTIQMTLDDDLVKAVDCVSKELCTTRSAFARKALRDALIRYSIE
jgi:metal-responsive CopG/Arc/MetJ family transcriptional regulator